MAIKTKKDRKTKGRRAKGPRIVEAPPGGGADLTNPTEAESGGDHPPLPGRHPLEIDPGLDGGSEPPPTESERPMPSETDAFEKMLRDMGVQEDYIRPITLYCSQENLKDLKRLNSNLWDMGISNVHLRRRIINFWGRSIGVLVPKELTQEFLTHDTGAPESVIHSTGGPGLRWIVEDDGAGNPKLRPSRPGESGMTLGEAKTAMKEMRDQSGQGTEPVVELNAESGQWVPNVKSAWVKNNLPAAWATAREYNRQMQEGNQPDPMDIMADQLAKVEQLKLSLGIKPADQAKTGTDDVFNAIAKVDEIARNRNQGGGLPGWITDPMAFINAMRTVNPPSTGPDPQIMAQMAEMKEDVKAARAENQALKDQIQNDRMEALRIQNQTILTQLQEVRTELARPRDGVTALGVIDKMGGKGIEELSGLRADIKNIAQTAMAGGPPTQDGAMRAARVAGMKDALATADRVGQLTDELDLALKG